MRDSLFMLVSETMKKYVLYIFVFFVVVAMVDVSFGFVCRYLNSHAKGGDTKNHYDIAMNIDAEVLMFGSSRCIHHYVPSILEDSLGMTAYNCGLDGNGILYQYSRLRMILNRYTPRVIVYDVTPAFDVAEGDNYKNLSWQKRFYDIPGVSDVFMDVNPMEKYKMFSQLYRYNSSFIQMLSDNIHPLQNVDGAGYKPMYGTMNYEPKLKERELKVIEWDSLKRKYFEKFCLLCKQKGIVLIVAYSPSYKVTTSIEYNAITDFCDRNNILLMDNCHNSDFSECRDYFADSSHLNDVGAREYTKYFAAELKKEVFLHQNILP